MEPPLPPSLPTKPPRWTGTTRPPASPTRCRRLPRPRSPPLPPAPPHHPPPPSGPTNPQPRPPPPAAAAAPASRPGRESGRRGRGGPRKAGDACGAFAPVQRRPGARAARKSLHASRRPRPRRERRLWTLLRCARGGWGSPGRDPRLGWPGTLGTGNAGRESWVSVASRSWALPW